MGALVQADRVVTGGVECRRDPARPSTWTYLPLAPWPQFDATGRPMVSVLTAGDTSLLQIGCQLDPPADRIEAARELIADRDDVAPPVVLRPAAVSVDSFTVVGRDGDGWTELARSTGSGFAPFTAVFQLHLDREAADALANRVRGRLEVRCQLVLDDGPALAVADIADWLPIDTQPTTAGPSAGLGTTSTEDHPC